MYKQSFLLYDGLFQLLKLKIKQYICSHNWECISYYKIEERNGNTAYYKVYRQHCIKCNKIIETKAFLHYIY